MNRILVCDDDREIVEAIEIYLQQEGYEVVKAYDGAEVLEILGRQKVDLLIIDVMMPKLDGIETLKKISDTDHVLVMLSDQMISVNRFFERPDREKQFLYQLLMQEPDPDAAMVNFREMLMRVNSKEAYDKFFNSGFKVLLRDDNRTVKETLEIVEELLRLKA